MIFATVCLAKWKNDQLCWNCQNEIYIRDSDRKVALKCLHNSHIINNILCSKKNSFFLKIFSHIKKFLLSHTFYLLIQQ